MKLVDDTVYEVDCALIIVKVGLSLPLGWMLIDRCRKEVRLATAASSCNSMRDPADVDIGGNPSAE
jgi:hypothetical protein